MPSSAPSLTTADIATRDALAASGLDAPPLGAGAERSFHVVPFRRARNGALVPGAAVPVVNGDIAWRLARAAAFDHDYVGAVAVSGSDAATSGIFTDSVVVTSFGAVNLDALRH